MVSVEQMKIAILGAVNQGVYANDNYWWKQLKRLAEEIESEALCPTQDAPDLPTACPACGTLPEEIEHDPTCPLATASG
jgi:hypothetical protein